ncbi:MAG: hypothetical protein HOD63_10785 [Bacteroidetes bacterium]|nr:hypothetical protein [Bacteroidota bacterium]MBT4729113.1 hypothetical protein [Bacteroidota bacterium]MBT7038975.1 hypothetical protein [Bacteroidota bacterium]MBT7828591.1 hypothetical protein [Bacteroidota bacterium]
MNKNILFLLLFISPFFLKAQEKDAEKSYGIKFSGFVKNDFFFDSRQTTAVREGHFLLYPKNVDPDNDGMDINAAPSFNFLSIQTRLKGAITGPDAFGAKTSGLIEGAFFGHTDGDINGFRLRHAYMKLNWEKTELLLGQTWHALFITDCFPGVVSFNTGVPFQPFSRNPQIRFTRFFGDLSLTVTAMSQRDFASPGGSTSLRNAVIPAMNVKLQYKTENKDKGSMFVAGVSGDAKALRPRLESAAGYQANQLVQGLSGLAYMKMQTKDITVKLEGVYGQNLFDLLMLGGYAHAYTDDTNMINKDLLEYTTMDNLSIWTEFHTNGKGFQTGVFAGFTKNMGSYSNIMDWTSAASYKSRGSNIDYVYRISPRLIYNMGKARFAAECEYTVAAYGSVATNNSLGQVQNAEEVSNLRLLLAAYYFF